MKKMLSLKGKRRAVATMAAVVAGLPVAIASMQGCGGGGGGTASDRKAPVRGEEAYCGTLETSDAQKAEVEAALDGSHKSRAGGTITIPVYVHIITNDAGLGDISDANIATQINVLNTAFAGGQAPGGYNTSFRFQLVRTDRTANSAWFTAHRDDANEVAMKTALRQGSADDLNLYVRDLQDGLAGYGGFPWWYADNPILDGPSLDYTGMPGGSWTQSNLGDLAVHEIGHWLGLYHTFQGGCTAQNDYVSDTPAELNYNWNCPTATVDTCTGNKYKGADPTMNFMDYTTDACKYQFTAGQSARMDSAWTTYRAGK